MTNKEINVRSIIFLIIGILLVLSLVICIYIVSGERDLKEIQATVVNVKDDKDGTGKNDVTVMYEVDDVTYEYNFYYKDDVKNDDKISIYYHKNNVNNVQPYKTSKLIFVCPIIGLILCIYGLIELCTKSKSYTIEDVGVKTKLVGEDERTQQLQIITDDAKPESYSKTPEEEAEVPIKELKGNQNKVVSKDNEATDFLFVLEDEEIQEEVVKLEAKTENSLSLKNDLVEEKEDVIKIENEKEKVKEEVKVAEDEPEVKNDIKENIKEKEVIKEEKVKEVVKEDEKAKAKEKVNSDSNNLKKKDDSKIVKNLKKVIPKMYTIENNELVYEELGKDKEKIDLEKINSITKTINSEGKLVKIVVNDGVVSCVLTSMKGIDLNDIMETLHHKMIQFDSEFTEKIEYKEY